MRHDTRGTIKVIVTDIDGTLTSKEFGLNLNVITVLQRIEKEKKIPIIFASGAVFPIVYGLTYYFKFTGPIIAENGGILCYQRNIYTFSNRERVNKAYEELQKHLSVKKLFTDIWRTTELALEPNVDIEKIKEVLKNWDLRIETTGYAHHITEKHVTKYNTLLKALELINVDIKNVLAIGDSENDIDMINNAGIGTCVQNADDRVKKVAKYIATKENGEGVIEILKKFGVI